MSISSGTSQLLHIFIVVCYIIVRMNKLLVHISTWLIPSEIFLHKRSLRSTSCVKLYLWSSRVRNMITVNATYRLAWVWRVDWLWKHMRRHSEWRLTVCILIWWIARHIPTQKCMSPHIEDVPFQNVCYNPSEITWLKKWHPLGWAWETWVNSALGVLGVCWTRHALSLGCPSNRNWAALFNAYTYRQDSVCAHLGCRTAYRT